MKGRVQIVIILSSNIDKKTAYFLKLELEKLGFEVDYGNYPLNMIVAFISEIDKDMIDFDLPSNSLNFLLNKFSDVIKNLDISIWIDEDRPPDIHYSFNQIIREQR
jgi:hypothetical protein